MLQRNCDKVPWNSGVVLTVTRPTSPSTRRVTNEGRGRIRAPPRSAASVPPPPRPPSRSARPLRTAAHGSSSKPVRLDAQMSRPRASGLAVWDTPWYARPDVHSEGGLACGWGGRGSAGGGGGGAPAGGGGSVPSTRRKSSRGAPIMAMRESNCHMMGERRVEGGKDRG